LRTVARNALGGASGALPVLGRRARGTALRRCVRRAALARAPSAWPGPVPQHSHPVPRAGPAHRAGGLPSGPRWPVRCRQGAAWSGGVGGGRATGATWPRPRVQAPGASGRRMRRPARLEPGIFRGSSTGSWPAAERGSLTTLCDRGPLRAPAHGVGASPRLAALHHACSRVRMSGKLPSRHPDLPRPARGCPRKLSDKSSTYGLNVTLRSIRAKVPPPPCPAPATACSG
jgi:hypothetical protein